MRLDLYDNSDFNRGVSRSTELLWLIFSGVFLSSWLPGSRWRVLLLRLFGARIGQGVVIKPAVCVKFPWRLTVGDHCWIGERVWIDNLAEVSLGDHVCVSQGVYLCTGSHDWGKPAFNLIVKPISVCGHAWLGAMSRVGPGVVVGMGAVLGFGSVATKSLDAWTIHCGQPAVATRARPNALDLTKEQ